MIDRVAPAGEGSAADRVLGFSAERLIAISRLVLATIGLLAICLDPFQPAHGHAGYALLVAYVVFSVAALLFANRGPGSAWQLGRVWSVASHMVDVILIATITFFTEGPTSPYFVFFTFLLFSGTLRWEWRGAIGTALALTAVLFVQGYLAFEQIDRYEWDRLVMRGAYLLVAGALFGYVGAYFERSRQRLAHLAAWPGTNHALGGHPGLERSLAHAGAVLHAREIVVLWERSDEPCRYIAHWSNGCCEFHHESPDIFGTVVAPQLTAVSFIYVAHGFRLICGGARRTQIDAIDRSLVERFAIANAATAPFARHLCSGRIFLLNMVDPVEEQLALVEIVAFRIGTALEDHLLTMQLQTTARNEERVRLAQDLHDSILQSLAAAGLQIKAALASAESEMRERITNLGQALSTEQCRIRALVEETRAEEPWLTDFPLYAEMERLLNEIKLLWNCDTQLHCNPPDAFVSRFLGNQIRLMLMEAVANAVQHSGATRVDVTLQREAAGILLRIWNNGRVPEATDGKSDHPLTMAAKLEPLSLRQRLERLKGSLSATPSRGGLELDIRLALPQKP